MNTNDLVALLYDAKDELGVLASYLDQHDAQWPTLGLKMTAKAHKRLHEQIVALLATEPSEEIPLRQENLALRASLAAVKRDEDWRARYLAAKFDHSLAFAERDAALATANALLAEALKELDTIEAITVSPTDTDGLIDLIKRMKAHLGVK